MSGSRPAPATPVRQMLNNAASLVGTSAVTSGLGFLFWWVAARLLPPEAVGSGMAAVAAMNLLGMLAMLGLGTLLISELPRRSQGSGGLTAAALLASLGGAVLIAATGGLVLGAMNEGYRWIVSGVWPFLLFVLGVALTTVPMVFDEAVIGVLRGQLQLLRNVAAAITKIVFLGGLVFYATTEHAIYAAWLLGNVLSVGLIAALTWSALAHLWHADWRTLRTLWPDSLRHHGLNLAMQAPSLALPVVVAAQVNAQDYARFYLCWMIAGFLGMIPYSLAKVLPAVAHAGPEVQQTRLRQSLLGSAAACVAGTALLIVVAPLLLGLFGPAYRGETVRLLQVLALTAFPLIVKAHYIALGRLNGRLIPVALTVALGGALELLAVVVGGHGGHLMRLTLALLAAYCLEALWMFPAVIRSTGWSLRGAARL